MKKREAGEAVFVDNWGYMMVVAPVGHPRARCKGVGSGSQGGSRGYIRRSRYTVEQSIGRYLSSNEHVHHKNGNKLDDRLENLEVIDPSSHSRLHWVHPQTRLNRPLPGDPCRKCESELKPKWDGKRGLCNACYLAAKRYRSKNGDWPEWAQWTGEYPTLREAMRAGAIPIPGHD